jgi:hypothetical protein
MQTLTIDKLIADLTEIRDRREGNGNLPVTLDAPRFHGAELVIAHNDEGGPITDPNEPLTGVQITTVF